MKLAIVKPACALVFAVIIAVLMTACADPQRWQQGRDWYQEVGKLEEC